jgi:hypothetical protein
MVGRGRYSCSHWSTAAHQGNCGRSKLVVLVDELGRVAGIISFIEGVRPDVERLRALPQLLDDLPPHLLRHYGL